MINITEETCFRLTEAPQHLPRRNGRKVSVSTIFRWAQIGVRGCRLEVVRVGGALHTSREAIQRFVERLTLVDQADGVRMPALGTADKNRVQGTVHELERLNLI